MYPQNWYAVRMGYGCWDCYERKRYGIAGECTKCAPVEVTWEEITVPRYTVWMRLRLLCERVAANVEGWLLRWL